MHIIVRTAALLVAITIAVFLSTEPSLTIYEDDSYTIGGCLPFTHCDETPLQPDR